MAWFSGATDAAAGSGGGSGFGDFMSQGGSGLVGGFLQSIFSIGSGKRAVKRSKELADYQYKKDMEMMKYQLDYNSPAAQMERFKQAGLNPNLVYGQGTPGNLESPPRFPKVDQPEYLAATQNFSQGLMEMQQARLLGAQADLTEQKVSESGVKQDVLRAQENLLKANPMLRPEYVNGIIDTMLATADMKQQELKYTYKITDANGASVAFQKAIGELENLNARNRLMELGAAERARVIQSKDYENALKAIQVNWMKDGDLTSEHWRQLAMMIIQSWTGLAR